MNILPGLRLASLCFASSVALFGAEPTVAPSPLLRAVRLGATAEWQTLLAAKADVHARDAAGNTALHFAAARGDNDMNRYLVSKGADVKAVARSGQTTADMANGPVQRISPYLDTVALLESLGSKNNRKCMSC